MKKNKKISFFVLVIIFFILIYVVSALTLNTTKDSSPSLKTLTFSKYEKNNVTSFDNIVLNCQNLSLENTYNCLQDNVAVIFKYKLINDNPRSFSNQQNFNDLVTFGGDCYDWSNLYTQLATKLGYDSKKVTIHAPNINPYNNHDFVIISNEKGYCILDMIYYGGCNEY